MTLPVSRRVQRVKPSPTLAVTARAAKLKAEGKDIVALGAGEPDFDTPAHIAAAGVDAIKGGFTRYTNVDGINELKDAIIAKFRRDNGIEYERSQVIVSSGAKQTIYNLCMAVLDPGLVQYALLQHPEWNLHQVALAPEPDKYPIMSTKYYSIMAIAPEEKELYEAINAEIAKAWESCANVKAMSEYGLGDPDWFKPPQPDYRNGVDRPADWVAPSSPASCFQQ